MGMEIGTEETPNLYSPEIARLIAFKLSDLFYTSDVFLSSTPTSHKQCNVDIGIIRDVVLVSRPTRDVTTVTKTRQ